MDQSLLKKIAKVALFGDYDEKQLEILLGCLNLSIREFDKNAIVLPQGAVIDQIGIVITGSLQLHKTDYFGNNAILATLGELELFGESFAGSRLPIPIEVIATTKTVVAFVDYDKIINPCSQNCIDHRSLSTKLVRLLAIKNIALTEKIDIITKRSTRAKILAYLNNEAARQNSRTFTIPFNRQELADYLVVDRSALSLALSKLKKEGLIDYHKNAFKITAGAPIPS